MTNRLTVPPTRTDRLTDPLTAEVASGSTGEAESVRPRVSVTEDS